MSVLIIRDIWDLGREGGHTMYRSVRIKGLSSVVQFNFSNKGIVFRTAGQVKLN